MQPSMILLVMARTEIPIVEDREGGLVLVVLGLLAVALASVVLAGVYFWVTGRTARDRFDRKQTAPVPAPPTPTPSSFYGNASTQTAMFESAPFESAPFESAPFESAPFETRPGPGPFGDMPGRGMLPRPVITNMAPPAAVEPAPPAAVEPAPQAMALPERRPEPQFDVPFASGHAAMGDPIEIEVIQALDGVPMPAEIQAGEVDGGLAHGDPGTGFAESGERPPEIPNW